MSCTLIDIFTSFPVQERLDTQSDRVEATNREPTSLENTDASDVSFKPKRCNYFYLIILVFAVHICYFACCRNICICNRFMCWYEGLLFTLHDVWCVHLNYLKKWKEKKGWGMLLCWVQNRYIFDLNSASENSTINIKID